MSVPILGFLLIAPVGCRHGGQADIATLAAGSDTALWKSASRDFDKRRYESARQYATRLVEGFPNSPNQPLARLLVADSHFKEGGTGSLIMAAAEYREFTVLYPSHTRADYAQLQVAECHFKQRHGAERDQTNTEKALEEFQRFLELHPDSTLADQARARVKTCTGNLARADFLVGYFYQRSRQAYRAAIQRYEQVLRDYPDYERTDEVLFRLGQSLVLAGRSAEALPHFARLRSTFPKSQFAGAPPAASRAPAAENSPTPSPK
jgi:outer membrane protein assembly factor BamD